VNAAVLTVSDGVSAGVREDTSGDVLEELLRDAGFEVERTVVTDDAQVISDAIRRLSDSGAAVVLTTGGTGFAPRDVTPEATRTVLDREAPRCRSVRARCARPYAACPALAWSCGPPRATLVVNLPGSPGLPRRVPTRARHGLELAAGDTASVTGRRDQRSRSAASSPSGVARAHRAHRVRAALRVRRGISLRGAWPGLANVVWITVAMVSSDARDVAQSTGRRRDRRTQPAHMMRAPSALAYQV
jgi:molybdenum cofactor synthesis domain-containing protein